ncbi:hypothetical protein Drorol1_Dr00012620 [Drosera rotundifolia]
MQDQAYLDFLYQQIKLPEVPKSATQESKVRHSSKTRPTPQTFDPNAELASTKHHQQQLPKQHQPLTTLRSSDTLAPQSKLETQHYETELQSHTNRVETQTTKPTAATSISHQPTM